jgi:hypothetical protein
MQRHRALRWSVIGKLEQEFAAFGMGVGHQFAPQQF